MSTLANSMKKVASFSRFPSRVWSKEAKRGKITARRKRGWKKFSIINSRNYKKEVIPFLMENKSLILVTKKFCESSSFVCLYGQGAICNGYQRRVEVSWKPALSFLSSLRKNNVFWTISARST